MQIFYVKSAQTEGRVEKRKEQTNQGFINVGKFLAKSTLNSR